MRDDRKQKLVVVGEGTAAARAVEEIVARGGRERFEITMFGREAERIDRDDRVVYAPDGVAVPYDTLIVT